MTNKIKRKISALLAAALCAIAASPAMTVMAADIPGYEVLHESEFDTFEEDKSFVPGQAGQVVFKGLTTGATATLPMNMSIDAEEDALVLGSGGFLIVNDFYPETKTPSIEFEFKQIGSRTAIDELYQAQDGPAKFNGAHIYSDGTNICAWNDTSANVIYENYSADTWYKLNVYFDMNALTYDVYIDDFCVARDFKLRGNATPYGADDIGRIFRVRSSDGQSPVAYRNIVIADDVREKMISDAVEELFTKYPTGIDSWTIELPTSDEEGYELFWESDSDIIDTETGTVTPDDEDTEITLTAIACDEDAHRSIIRDYEVKVIGRSKISAPGYRIHFASDLESYEEDKVFQTNVSGQTVMGLDVPGWVNGPVGLSVDAEEDALVFASNSTAILSKADASITSPTIEFKFKQIGAKTAVTNLYQLQDNSAKYNGICLNSDGKDIYAYNYGNLMKIIADYQADTWYKITIHPDLTAKRYDIYVNDKCVGEDFEFRGPYDAAYFGRYIVAKVAADQSPIAFKDFVVATDKREEIATGIADAFYAAYEGGIVGADEIILPTTEEEGYTVTWQSADSTVVNAETGEVTHSTEDKTVTLTAVIADESGIRSIERKYDVTVTARSVETVPDYRIHFASDLESYEEDKVFVKNVSGQTAMGLDVNGWADGPVGLSVDAEEDALVFASNSFGILSKADASITNPTIEFKFKQIGTKTAVTNLYQLQDTYAKYNGICLNSDGKDIYAYSYGNLMKIIADYQADTWYKITIHPDLTAKRYDIYVNDKCVGEDFEFRGLYDAAYFGRYIVAKVAADQSPIAFKDFVVATDKREAILTGIVDTFYTAYNGGVVLADEIVLPTTEEEGYTVTWQSSDSTIVNVETGKVTHDSEYKEVLLTATVSDVSGVRSISRQYTVKVPEKKAAIIADDTQVVATVAAGDAANEVFYLAIYQGDTLVEVAVGVEKDGLFTASVDKSTLEAGSYNAMALLWEKDTMLPIVAAAELSFEK